MKKQLKLFSLLAVIIVGMFAVAGRLFFLAANATYVEGHITKDTTWTLVDSPFVVSNDVVVDPNVILTIEPSVEVRFGGNFSMFIKGALYANGTSDRPITFTSNKPSPQKGDWGTIKFNATTQSALAYCSVKYATSGITVENGNLTITNSEIANNLASGISVTGDNQVTIQNNTLRANKDGILLTGNSTAGVSIRQNIFSLNTQSGIQLGAGNYINLILLNNTVSANKYGFYISSNATTTITNNSISYNSVGIFYECGEDHGAHFNDIYGNDKGMDVSNAIVNATYNYWGDASGPYHISLRPDGKGDPVGGDGVNLDFIPWLTAPIGYINQRPTASLLSDAKVVRPNQAVTFFATTSSDDRRVDQYYFNFGDGQNSGWTTLSVFIHKYSSVRTYYANVTVRDDFGVESTNVATVKMDVLNLPSLQVSLTSLVTAGSGQQVPITVYATDGASPVANANITLFSIVGGSFTPSFGLTNSTGHFTTVFSPPNVTKKAYVRITATASKNDYADGSDYENLSVLPLLSVDVAVDPNLIKSEAACNGTVHVTHDTNPVVNASIKLSSDSGGSFSPETGSTNANGDFNFTFRAPQTLTRLNVTITATATKSDYWDGAAQTKVTIDPKTLTVQVTADPATVESKAVSSVIVHVTSDGIPVANATVSLLSDLEGNFSATSGKTDANGDFRVNFTAPEITTQVNVTITASAAKSGYVSGERQTKIIVNPVPSPLPTVGGLPLTTILLIAIPIVVVAIVAVLIKAKIIVISREEE